MNVSPLYKSFKFPEHPILCYSNDVCDIAPVPHIEKKVSLFKAAKTSYSLHERKFPEKNIAPKKIVRTFQSKIHDNSFNLQASLQRICHRNLSILLGKCEQNPSQELQIPRKQVDYTAAETGLDRFISWKKNKILAVLLLSCFMRMNHWHNFPFHSPLIKRDIIHKMSFDLNRECDRWSWEKEQGKRERKRGPSLGFVI